jgi:3-oxoacyl-(acyl-carrier-protein) synthase
MIPPALTAEVGGPRAWRRVAVTGVGVVSPLGTGTEAHWAALREPVAAGVSSAGESRTAAGDGPGPRTTGRIGRLALAAARLAVADARREESDGQAAAGVFLGANLDDVNLVGLCRALRRAGGSLEADPDWGEFARQARELLHPFDYLQALSNMPAAHLAIRYRARGTCCSYLAHGISGVQAIGDAYLAVREGTVAWALAGGADSWLTPLGAWRRGVLGGQHRGRCRPFSARRSRPRLGEGAALMVLETVESARARGRRVYAEIASYATALDAAAFPAPAHGGGLARCIRSALSGAGIDPRAVAYLGAHAEGSVDGDRLEARALRAVFGAALPPLGCLKTRTGHLGAASGALEAAVTALAIDHQQLPEGARPAEIDPDLGLAAAPPTPARRGIEWALNIAHHPLGLCAALVLRRASDAGESTRAGRPCPSPSPV